MNPAARPGLAALIALALASAGIAGCGQTTGTTPTAVTETPAAVLEPTAPGEGEATPSPTTIEPTSTGTESESAAEPAPGSAAVEPRGEAGLIPTSMVKPAEGEVTLLPVSFDELKAKLAAKGGKLTLVDAWATWCTPCKENFPHLVAMHAQYADRGLNVVSLSLDDPLDSTALDDARAFLRAQKAVFANFVLDEEQEDAFDKLDIAAIPAVFLFAPDGKEVRRFTMDDPNNQFTYDEVEEIVAGMLGAPAGGEKASD